MDPHGSWSCSSPRNWSNAPSRRCGEVSSSNSVQFSPLTDWVVRGHNVGFTRDPLPVFSEGGSCEQFWHGQGCPLFDVVHPAFPLPTTASSTLQGALRDGIGEAAVVCDMPEPCKFTSLNSCQKRFLWTHKEADLALHPVVFFMFPCKRTAEEKLSLF